MSETVAVVDYGMGNLHSAGKALEKMAADGQRIVITGDPEQVRAADRVVFPGVGAIRDCIKVITETGLDRAILDAIDAFGRPVGQAFQLRDDLLGVLGDRVFESLIGAISIGCIEYISNIFGYFLYSLMKFCFARIALADFIHERLEV